jgi:hypothetical protein
VLDRQRRKVGVADHCAAALGFTAHAVEHRSVALAGTQRVAVGQGAQLLEESESIGQRRRRLEHLGIGVDASPRLILENAVRSAKWEVGRQPVTTSTVLTKRVSDPIRASACCCTSHLAPRTSHRAPRTSHFALRFSGGYDGGLPTRLGEEPNKEPRRYRRGSEQLVAGRGAV